MNLALLLHDAHKSLHIGPGHTQCGFKPGNRLQMIHVNFLPIQINGILHGLPAPATCIPNGQTSDDGLNPGCGCWTPEPRGPAIPVTFTPIQFHYSILFYSVREACRIPSPGFKDLKSEVSHEISQSLLGSFNPRQASFLQAPHPSTRSECPETLLSGWCVAPRRISSSPR